MAYHYIERLGFVTRVEDLEGVLAPKLYKALLEIDNVKEQQYLARMDEINDLKDELNGYELLADERMAQLRNGTQLVEEIIKYVETAGRIDRRKLLDMLTEVKEDLNNY